MRGKLATCMFSVGKYHNTLFRKNSASQPTVLFGSGSGSPGPHNF